MIRSFAYDVEVLPNFFSVVIIDVKDYLNIFKDSCTINHKGKKVPIPLIQKYTVKEIIEKLDVVKKQKFYITDTDDSQLLDMLSYFNKMKPHYEDKIAVRCDLFGYNSSNYDRLMIAGLLMYYNQVKTTKELITNLYELSKEIISLQNDKKALYHNYTINSCKNYKLPYIDIDVMTIFALNKVGKGVDKDGNPVYFGKSLKQTSINLQWYELLEHELPPISKIDYKYYTKIDKYRGYNIEGLNKLVDKWDRYVVPEWVQPIMHYNCNDVFIVCEIIRLYSDEIKLRYNISNAYNVDVLSSSRSNIADKLFIKFYSDFSGLTPKEWRGKKTIRTALSFKKVIFPFIKFKTKELQDVLTEMKKTTIYSVNKTAFEKEIKLGNLVYTIATGGLHSKDIPRELRSKLIYLNPSSTGEESKSIWDNITDDSFIYIHWDISDAVPHIKILL